MKRGESVIEELATEERLEALESMIQEERANTRSNHVSFDRAVECTRRLVHLQGLAKDMRRVLGR